MIPTINFRFLNWSIKDGGVLPLSTLVFHYFIQIREASVPFEAFLFELQDGQYRLAQSGTTYNSEMLMESDLLIVATVSSPVLDSLLSQCDIEQAGHLRDSGPNAVFSHKISWPDNLAPGPSDVLIVIEKNSNLLTIILQRRLLTPHRLNEIRSGV